MKYQIEYSTDGGKAWRPVVKDWQVVRREPDPKDFWSQSFSWGEVGRIFIENGRFHGEKIVRRVRERIAV